MTLLMKFQPSHPSVSFTYQLLSHPTHTRDAMAEYQYFVISPPSGEISTASQVDFSEHLEWLHRQ
jgi:hypothetical protein